MSNDVEYDPFEYAKELAAGADLGHGDLEGRREPSGITRGELLKRGAVDLVGMHPVQRSDPRAICSQVGNGLTMWWHLFPRAYVMVGR